MTAFRSPAVERDDGGLTVRGELELGGARRPASFELHAGADGRDARRYQEKEVDDQIAIVRSRQ